MTTDNAAWVKEQCVLLSETNETMAPAVLGVVTHVDSSLFGDADFGLELALKLLEKGWIQFSDLIWRSSLITSVSAHTFEAFLENAIHSDREGATETGISFLSYRLEKHPDDVPRLASFAIQLLKQPVNKPYDYAFLEHWYMLAHTYVADNPVHIVDAALNLFKSSNIFYDEHHEAWKILREAIRQSPEDTWATIGNRLLLPSEDPDTISEYQLRSLRINSLVPADILVDWAGQHLPEGPQILAEMTHVGKNSFHSIVRFLLIKFGEDELVYSHLRTNFLDLGFIDLSREAELLQSRRDTAISWASDENPIVRKWVQDIIHYLNVRIDRLSS